MSFVLSHELKEKHWLEDQAEKTDLPLDDYLMDDMYDEDSRKQPSSTSSSSDSGKKGEKGAKGETADKSDKKDKKKAAKTAVKGIENEKHGKQKKELQAMKKELAVLLETPIPSISRVNNPATAYRSSKGSASALSNDWRRRKVGFFVYTPPAN